MQAVEPEKAEKTAISDFDLNVVKSRFTRAELLILDLDKRLRKCEKSLEELRRIKREQPVEEDG